VSRPLSLLTLLVALHPAAAHAAPVDAATFQPDRRAFWTVSGAGGADLALDQLWGGAEVALHPLQRRGLAPQARFTPAFSLTELAPLFLAEVGGSVVLPYADSPEATIRVGLVARAAIPVVTSVLPVRVGQPGTPGPGVVPSGLAFVEFGWLRRSRPTGGGRAPRTSNVVFGFRAGPGALASNHQCTSPTADPDTCIVWLPGLVASFYLRVDLPRGLHLEAHAGNTFRLALGRWF
jgi:hypothetical protein